MQNADSNTTDILFTINYELKVRECWNNLTECEERLSIGL